jgi:hypothetical protein
MSAEGFHFFNVLLLFKSKLKFLLAPVTYYLLPNPLQEPCSGFLIADCDSKNYFDPDSCSESWQ